MPESVPFAALVFVLFAIDVAVALTARRIAVGGGAESGRERIGNGRVRCPDCETVDYPDYRFCRECVTELQDPAAVVRRRPAGGRSPFP